MGAQRLAATPTPTPCPSGLPTGRISRPATGLLQALSSLLGIGAGIGEDPARLAGDDSRRPPGSGNIDWVLMNDRGHRPASRGNVKARTAETPKPVPRDGVDEFVIGVQDWRDPDLLVPKSSPSTKQFAKRETPQPRKPAQAAKATTAADSTRDLSVSRSSPARGEGGRMREVPKPSNPPSREIVDPKVHDGGLWVTLTPASVATSPFLDTLLVLVVSPLLTLSVVYALLLLRSRIRRRRWRAPKSVVDRLPVRTYHTISATSSAASSVRSPSPDSSSPTDPLITSGASETRRSRPKSQMTAPSKKSLVSSNKKGSTLWRRKYTGRQVECVVCLEEYVDGQSRVMSLPCGHEFHAECMYVFDLFTIRFRMSANE